MFIHNGIVMSSSRFSQVLYTEIKIYLSYLLSHYIVSVHFNNLPSTEICNKLMRDLSMLTYIYLNVDEYVW